MQAFSIRAIATLAVALSLCAGRASAAAPVYTVVYAFYGWAYPNAVVPGPNNTLIGTVFGGGAAGSGCSSLGCGAIYQWVARRNAALLHGFNGQDGGSPATGLVPGPAGVFYGTTYYGGPTGADAGTVFSLSGSTLNTIYTFSGNTDGGQPDSLILANDGNLYGTTNSSGFGTTWGTIFRLTTGGSLTTLKTYTGGDGIKPIGIMQANDGNFYGTVQQSGNTTQFGTAFRLTPAGVYTTLHTFVDADGGMLQSGLIQASDGNFYGVASEGGNPTVCPHNFAPGCGTIFRMTPSGVVTVVHYFNYADGSEPYGALLQASDGYLYGTTAGGGPGKCSRVLHVGCGTIFRISLSGQFTTLHTFRGIDGANPMAALIEVGGVLYGTTNRGGNYGFGAIFRITRP
jgi:uncharacterized repeat protein (TIGR03803 family)